MHTARLRSRSRTRKHLSMALAALAATTIPARAAPPFPPPPLEDRIEALELDESTRGRVYAVLDETEGKRRATRREIESARRHLREQLADSKSTDDAIRADAAKLDQLERTAEQQRIDVLLAIRALLPERLRGALAPPPPERDRAGRPRAERSARCDGDPGPRRGPEPDPRGSRDDESAHGD